MSAHPHDDASRPTDRWAPISELSAQPDVSGDALAALDKLRDAWEESLARRPERERVAARNRTLNRLAVETGIIERLYEIEWGLTLNLVAEGLTREVVERNGGHVDPSTLDVIRSQRDALDLVADVAAQRRPLTPAFVKELHAAFTRTQRTYAATDALGRRTDRELVHGAWKVDENHVLRADGSRLEFCPAVHVASEMERLCDLYAALELRSDVHALVRCAWLHHRFVRIHPFPDGNGRVARALSALVLQRARFAPLVVDRWTRDAYLAALDAANEGDLAPLTTLFVRLEQAALMSELAREDEPDASVGSDVVRAFAEQLKARTEFREASARRALAHLVTDHFERLRRWFESRAAELRTEFGRLRLDETGVAVFAASPADADRYFYRAQVARAAGLIGYTPNFSEPRSYVALRVRHGGLELRFVASLHVVGREAGVGAVLTFAEIGEFRIPRVDDEADGAVSRRREFIQTSEAAFNFVHSESHMDLERRFEEQATLLDYGLRIAVAAFLRQA